MPLIGLDEERIRSMRPAAEQIARDIGATVALVRFGRREDVETIGGDRNYG